MRSFLLPVPVVHSSCFYIFFQSNFYVSGVHAYFLVVYGIFVSGLSSLFLHRCIEGNLIAVRKIGIVIRLFNDIRHPSTSLICSDMLLATLG